MKYIINKVFLLLLRVLNKFRKLINKNSILLSSRKILERNFKTNRDFSFIQIGANDGVSFDFLYDFVIERNSKGVLVEPASEYFKELNENYKNFPNIIRVNKAVHPTLKELKMYLINPNAKDDYPDWVKGIASLDPNHHKKTNIDSRDIITEIVKADTLSSIIKGNYNTKYVDYFQIDTEGFDFEILKMLDFKLIEPLVLKFESVNLSRLDKDFSVKMLEQKGYYIFDELGDTVAVNLKKVKIAL